MNDLRLILIILGVIIILFVYFYDSVKNRQNLHKKVKKFISRDSTDELFSMKIKPEDDADLVSELKEIINASESEPVSIESFNLKPRFASTGPDIESRENKEKNTEQLVVIYIKAKTNKKFSGIDIFRAAESAGLKPGSMNIFHHYLEGEGETGRALFSLANMLEPGSFEFDNPGKNNTAGLVMFMQLPSLVEPPLVFDLMCHTAEKISAELDGELFGSDRKILDSKAMMQLREKLMI